MTIDEFKTKYTAEYMLKKHGIYYGGRFVCLNPLCVGAQMDYATMILDETTNDCVCQSCGRRFDIFSVYGMDYGAESFAEQRDGLRKYFGITEDISGTNRRNGITASDALLSAVLSDYGISEETARRHGIEYVGSMAKHTGKKTLRFDALRIPVGNRRSYVAVNTDTNADEDARFLRYGVDKVLNAEQLTVDGSPIYVTSTELDALCIEDVGGRAVSIGIGETPGSLVGELSNLGDKKVNSVLLLALEDSETGHRNEETLATELKRLNIRFSLFRPYVGMSTAVEAIKADRTAFAEMVAQGADSVELSEQREYVSNTNAADFIETLKANIEASRSVPAIRTGFSMLDAALDGGLYPGLYFVGAIPALGKTTLTLQIGDQIAAAGHDVLIVALEMSKSELMAKSISRESYNLSREKVNGKRLATTARGILDGKRYDGYSAEQAATIGDAISRYRSYADHIFILEGLGNIGVNEVRDAVMTHERITGHAPVLVLDYLQILAPLDVRASDKQNTDRAVLELKRISRDFNIPVIGVSSFNRPNYNAPVQMVAFKESGAIEYGCDVLLGLQYKGVGTVDFKEVDAANADPREIELVILKNRYAAPFKKIEFEFVPMFNSFTETGDGEMIQVETPPEQVASLFDDADDAVPPMMVF